VDLLEYEINYNYLQLQGIKTIHDNSLVGPTGINIACIDEI
jgi:hypothetical protein